MRGSAGSLAAVASRCARVFLSYAREDERFREELCRHLAPMVHEGEIEILQDRLIRPGSVWEQEIKRWLEEADVFLLLVSEHYFHSKICTKVELSRALERAAGGGMLLIPVIVSPVDWQATQIGRFNALPADGHPVTKHADRGDAYVNIAQGLRRALEPSHVREQELPAEHPRRTQSKTLADASAKTGVAAEHSDVTAAYDYVHPATVFFRGRDREIAILRSVIRGGRSAAVFGLQRVGKTSLVEKAISSVIHDTSAPFPVTVMRINMFSGWESFQNILDFFNVVVSELAKAAGQDPLPLRKSMQEVFTSSSDVYPLQEIFRNILQKARSITRQSLLLFIDEFQDIELAFERARQRNVPMRFDAGIMRLLGSLIKDGILQVLLCCRFQAADLEQRERMELFKLMELINLGPLEEASARALIRDPVANVIHYDEEAVRRIIDLTGGFPYFIQFIGSQLAARPRVGRTGQVRSKDVEDCADEMLDSQINEPRFSVLYEDYKKLQAGQPWKVMLCLAELSKVERQAIPYHTLAASCRDHAGIPDKQRLHQFLKLLGMTQLITEDKRSPEPTYRFRPELLRRWLRLHTPIHLHM